MKTPLSTGLITDGSSDQALIPLLSTLLEALLPETGFVPPQWVPPAGRKTLAHKIAYALDIENFQFDILFVHRDAENEAADKRVEEIQKALPTGRHPVICVVPVKMTEAWLLTSESAIKQAVGNPRSTAKLELPALSKIASCDAKLVLDEALTLATERNARRRGQFKPSAYRRLVAECTTDLTALRKISSFQQLETDLIHLLKQKNIPHAEL
ncbi:MAG: hypothetical protein RLZZ352_46 [Pseudomonadota bacterium]|jgi:hypothetical protein